MSEVRPALRIDRARLANPRPGDRGRLAAALERASPAATGVEANGLLLIRKLQMERPLAAGLDGFAGELIDRIRAAKVEARRSATHTADSLYFADETALECAMVSAWLSGAPLPQLVRRTVRDGDAPRLRWRRRILGDARKLPRMIATLAEGGIAGAWLAHFDDAELIAAADLLVRAHGGVAAHVARRADVVVSPAEGSVPPTSPTEPIPAIAAALAEARACATGGPACALILLCLLAVRRPELLGTQAVAKARAALEASATACTDSGVTEWAVDTTSAASTTWPVPVDDAGPIAPPETAQPRAGPRTPTSARRNQPAGRSEAPEPGRAEVRSPLIVSPPPTNPTLLPGVAPEMVTSAHAGLFFLLNIFLALGLYGDFSDPVRRLRGLSPFELMLLLARHWLGQAFARDPLQPLLRALAGLAPREPVGRNFEAPAWQAPEDWLAPWPAAPARRFASPLGETRWHSAGFPIGDEWRLARPAAWMRRRWVACLARYLEARVARALGSDDRSDAIAMLISRPGTVAIQAAQVEVAFQLDTHPLAIRLAGLDRDPGWIPAAGRNVEFHFA